VAPRLDAHYAPEQDERLAAAKVLTGPTDIPKVNRQQLIDDVRQASERELRISRIIPLCETLQALYAAKICSYAQGMNLIREAAKQLGWTVNLGESHKQDPS
jgi:6-phosphogluconate dehydrogenase